MVNLSRRDTGTPRIAENAASWPDVTSLGGMDKGTLFMHSLIHWMATNGSVLAGIVTAGVAVLLACCLGCSNCSCRDKDDLFSRHEM